VAGFGLLFDPAPGGGARQGLHRAAEPAGCRPKCHREFCRS
jgi:hypothetical protein